jgi:phosphatidylglycerophosphate synthase
MLVGLFKSKLDRFWNQMGAGLARSGVSPNMVTLAGMGLTFFSCLYFLLSADFFGFGIFLAITFTSDSLDGAVARLTNRSSKFGSYLDAVVDRYQEILVYLTLGIVTEFWIPVFIAVTGSLLVSYNKARVAVDTPISNHGWPDLMERMERLILICMALILEGLFPDHDIMKYLLILMGILTHLTAVQRFFRAKNILIEIDKKGPRGN